VLPGEVWLVVLPFGAGREQTGQRPAIVVQDAIHGQGSPLVIVVPVTGQSAALRFPGSVEIAPTRANGLTVPSVAMTFQLRALDRARLCDGSGRFPKATSQPY